MSKNNKLNRRKFVQLAVMGTGSVCFLPQCHRTNEPWRFFTTMEALVIDAIAEQIIPSDDWPGGHESGVTNYIDKQLTGPFTRFQSNYRKGIAALTLTCNSRFQKKFEEIEWNEQTFLLEEMEAGKMKEPEWGNGFDREFFRMVRDHSMQAYYGSPVHGGNKNKMSYKMIGLDYPLIIGQNRYNS
jgi:gluconate 2-dehydrogenase gamma chain